MVIFFSLNQKHCDFVPRWVVPLPLLSSQVDVDLQAEELLVHGMSREELTALVGSMFERMDEDGEQRLRDNKVGKKSAWHPGKWWFSVVDSTIMTKKNNIKQIWFKMRWKNNVTVI